MLTIAENITINADINKIWAFLTDFSLSLNFNRFHTKLELPAQYSIGKLKKFKIDHNFGFGKYEMVQKSPIVFRQTNFAYGNIVMVIRRKVFLIKLNFKLNLMEINVR